MDLTQEGIAESVLSGRSTVAKWLRRLTGLHLIAFVREHVPGRPLRKTVYRLTETGLDEARRLRQRLETDVVAVRVSELEPVRMRVAQVPEVVPWVDLTYVVASVKQGLLDLSRLPGPTSAKADTNAWGPSVRRPTQFFGRSDEMRALESWYRSSSKVLIVVGLPGIGKSALVSSWLLRYQRTARAVWTVVSEDTTDTRFLAELTTLLSRLRRRSLALSFAEWGHPDLGLLSRILAGELQDDHSILIIDDVQQASPAVCRLLAEGILPLSRATPMRVILISRSTPPFVERLQTQRRFGAIVLRIKGLDPQASRSLLLAKGFKGDKTAAASLIASARGHPLILSLAAAHPATKDHEPHRYVEEEIWRAIPPSHRRVLELASIFRRTAPPVPLRALTHGTDAFLRDLEATTLLAPTISGEYVVHETIREFVLARLRKEQNQRLHRKAASYFLGRPTSRERLEALYHLLAADRRKEAAVLLNEEAPSLLDSVAASEVVELLRDSPRNGLDATTSCTLCEALGDSLRILGHLTPARLEYRHALRQATTVNLPDRIPRLLRKLAFLDRCRGRLAAALGRLVEARARLTVQIDTLETGEVLREMALVEQAQGHLDAAVACASESVDKATEASSPATLARCLSVLGTLLTQKGDVEGGLQHKLESLRIADHAGNLSEVSRSCITVGTSYHELGRFAEALSYYEKGLQIARLLGNLRLTACAALDRAVALLDLRRYQESGEPIEEARHLFQILEEPNMLAVLDINEGQRYMGLGRWAFATRSWERGLHALRKTGDTYELLRSLDDVAGHYSDYGETEAARALWKEAQRLARQLGNPIKAASMEKALANAGPPAPSRARPSHGLPA